MNCKWVSWLSPWPIHSASMVQVFLSLQTLNIPYFLHILNWFLSELEIEEENLSKCLPPQPQRGIPGRVASVLFPGHTGTLLHPDHCICCCFSLECSFHSGSHEWKWKSLRCVWLFVTPWNSPGQNTGVGSLSPLQQIFPTQGSNWRWILYWLSHKGSPRTLEWVAYPFSIRSSQE